MISTAVTHHAQRCWRRQMSNYKYHNFFHTDLSACCKLLSYPMGHKPDLHTPSHPLLQKQVGWSSLIQVKLDIVSGSTWSKGKRCGPGSQTSRGRLRIQATRELSRTWKPRAVTFIEGDSQILLILNLQKHGNSSVPGLLDYSLHQAQYKNVSTYCSRK